MAGDLVLEDTTSYRHAAKKDADTKGPLVILHTSWPAQIWTIFIALCLIYLCFALPFVLAFTEENTKPKLVTTMDDILDWVFIIDILINLVLSTQTVDGVLVQDHCGILKNYLTGWFTIDLISSIPYQWFLKSKLEGMKAIKIVRIFKLIKLTRMSKLGRLVPVIQQKLRIKNSYMAIVKFVFFIFCAAHWLGCGFFLLAKLQDFPSESWASGYPDGDPVVGRPMSSQYLISLYWSFTTMTTIGYGDICPGTDVERVWMLFAMCVGSSIFAYGVSNMCTLVFNLNEDAVLFSGLYDSLQKYLESRNVPHALTEDSLNFIFYRHLRSGVDMFNESEVLDQLSKPLRRKVLMSSVGPILGESRLIIKLGLDEVLYHIVDSLEPQVHAAGEVLLKYGIVPDSILFVSFGEVDLLSDFAEASKPGYVQANRYSLCAGTSLGEAAAILRKPNTCCALTTTNADVYSLTVTQLDDFFGVCQNGDQKKAELQEDLHARGPADFELPASNVAEVSPSVDIIVKANELRAMSSNLTSRYQSGQDLCRDILASIGATADTEMVGLLEKSEQPAAASARASTNSPSLENLQSQMQQLLALVQKSVEISKANEQAIISLKK